MMLVRFRIPKDENLEIFIRLALVICVCACVRARACVPSHSVTGVLSQNEIEVEISIMWPGIK
jgi:hypothetical protein